MSKYSSAKYYQNNNERLQKQLAKDIEVSLKNKKVSRQSGMIKKSTRS